MNAPDLENVEAGQKRVALAVEQARWDEAAESLTDLLWLVAEKRPDFEKLPSWIAETGAENTTGDGSHQAVSVIEKIHTILGFMVSCYGDANDRIAFAEAQSQFVGGRREIPFAEMAYFAADVAGHAINFHQGVRRLPLAIHNDELHIGRHTRISFNRTLRVPEDGRAYPLPAGFGRLPILRVEDYAENIPEKWLEQGGFIIPLYQREALFLEFAGVKWRPTIGKVSVGRINAISGKEHDLKIRPHRQDYVVIPDQHWLDGINSENGSVSQFVAMPLGKGYTIEAQITDEEKYGGFQLAIFDPRNGRFPDQDPKEIESALATRKQRAFRSVQHSLLDRLPSMTVRVIRAVQEQHYQDAAPALGISEKEILQIIQGACLHLEDVLGANGFEGIIPYAHLKEGHRGMFMPNPRGSFMPSAGPGRHIPIQRPPSAPTPVVEMGIARGGTIKQQILEDTYGTDSWDAAAFRDVVIHIVNSEVYQQITGRKTPPSPITAEHYRRYKIPWYSDYKEKAPSLSLVANLKRILSVEHIDKNRGIVKDLEQPRREIQPAEIVRIHTEGLEERRMALVERAAESSKKGHHRIAAREASLALDLSDKYPLPFFIRAVSNHHLGQHADAEADASACLKLQPKNKEALRIRAYSSLALGEILLAKNDAEMMLALNPNDHDALDVLAHVSSKCPDCPQTQIIDTAAVQPSKREPKRVRREPVSFENYALPELDLLDAPDMEDRQAANPAELKETQMVLIETLAQFRIDASPGDISKGPTITRYELYPAKGVRMARILSLERDLARAMHTEHINILAPIPGKDTVGIEIANSRKVKVTLRELLESDDWANTKAKIPLALGKDVYGKTIIADLAQMPHCLVAGTTGSGKSVCINSIIASMLYHFTPDEMRFVMIDPKVVEMQVYNTLPHLVVPVVTDPKKVLLALRWVVDEIEKRYKIFAKSGVRNITSFNARPKPKSQKELDAEAAAKAPQRDAEDFVEEYVQKVSIIRAPRENDVIVPEHMGYIVVIVDDLAELMQAAPADVESAIARITQRACAAGIHMVVTTQTLRDDIVTAAIIENIPTRIAFQLNSIRDSKIMLNEPGAELLLGMGDMLFLPQRMSQITRIQGGLETDDEIRRLVEFVSKQGTSPFKEQFHDKMKASGGAEEDVSEEDEELVQKCIEIMRQEKRASTSLFQRRLRLGYTRSARVVDILEQRGYVGPENGAKPREILVDLDSLVQ